jgi:Phage tail sheath C-terminal domain
LYLEKELIMALVSPGVEVTVIDESQYIPSAVNTVPYFLIATAQNKVSSNGVTVAAGTLAANANKTYLITSQRDLAATFGVPFFYQTTTGTPINGYELNEYGLLAAYSSLGITNRCYVQRVDIDLTELTASLIRPTGSPANGDYWLDTATSVWGIQEYNQTTNTFTVKTPVVLTNTADIVDPDTDPAPLTSVGSIGDYAVVACATNTQLSGYYKNSNNAWVQAGSDAWKISWPTIQGTATPTTLTASASMFINDSEVFVPAASSNTVAGFAGAINAASIAGVTAAAVSGKLYLYADSTATNDASTSDGGIISIETGSSAGAALLTALGIVAQVYRAPEYLASYSYQAPRWAVGQTAPAPTGSIWNNVSPANNGLSLRVKKYSSSLATFVAQACPAYFTATTASYTLDPTGGGKNIPVGTTIVIFDAATLGNTDATMSFEILERYSLGATVVTGSTNTPAAFTNGNSFTITGSQLDGESITGTATISGTTVSAFITAVSAAAVPYVSASVNSAGAIVFTHSQGGQITLVNVTGTPTTTAGFTTNTALCRPSFRIANGLTLSNWVGTPTFTYTASNTTLDENPDTGRLWYYSTVSDADIMIQNNGLWVGYQTCTNDVRGYDLSTTNANGPIIAATAPTTQNDAALSPLVYGDLWIDTSDLENYPKLYRWEVIDSVDQWIEIDTTDQTTQNGILFADARWAPNGTTDPVMDAIPTIDSLLTSSYLDLDAPNPQLYPQGVLLFNTRRSGYNVKSFQSNYFNPETYPADPWASVTTYSVGSYVSYSGTNYISLQDFNTNNTPGTTAYWTPITETNAWLTASGNRDDGAMWSGRQAQRQLVVQAMKAGIDTSSAAREEQAQFSLIAATAYPELIPNMVALSNERNNTLFVVGDTPMRLAANGTDLAAWATNNGGLGFASEDGLVAASQYLGTFYPSCQTTDTTGNPVVTAPSHMMMRTIIRSDAVSYPWLAPAGTRRGVVDNAVAIGYIDAATGEFQQINVGQGLRDVLYENDINPITFIPGVGITNFGNKTTTSITSALDRINVSRLVAFLRGRLEEIGKLYLFEPNDDITRAEITNTVNSLMIDLIAKRGIYDYLVVCDLSNNTPARIDRNELWVDIAIEPVKAVEFIYIPLRIKNTGEISGQAS